MGSPWETKFNDFINFPTTHASPREKIPLLACKSSNFSVVYSVPDKRPEIFNETADEYVWRLFFTYCEGEMFVVGRNSRMVKIDQGSKVKDSMQFSNCFVFELCHIMWKLMIAGNNFFFC